jgi:hypothetical protein
MRKSYRSLLLTGAVMAAVAACGDDVTINPTTHNVNSVSVAPDGAVLPVGQTLQMIAVVNADSGVATTVTWSSSDQAKATVSATGLVTAVASGSVAIQACSTVSTGVCGAATVTIPNVIPATITIGQITNTVVGTGEVPVNVNNVAGQINVSLNFEPGSTPAQRVELLLSTASGDSVVQTQTFSIAQWAALVEKAQESGDELAAVVLQMSVNTAAFDATTGKVSFFNGTHTLKARAVLQGGNQVASTDRTLIFNNNSGFIATLTTDNGTDPATAINTTTGLQWLGGNVVIKLVGVSYVSGTTVASVGFTVLGKVRTATLTDGVATLTWSEGTTWTAGNTGVGGYMSPAVGDSVVTAPSAVLSDGQSVPVPAVGSILLNGTGGTPALQVVRVDNVVPGGTAANPSAAVQPALTLAAVTNPWLNAAATFAPGKLGVPTQSSLNGTDLGVDAVKATFYATAANGSLPASACDVTGLTVVTTGASLTESSATVYLIRVVFEDALGNETCLDLGLAGFPAPVGADFTAPTGTITGPAANTGFNVLPGNFAVTASDNASGFDLVAPLLVTMTRLEADGSVDCEIGSGTGCTTAAARALTFDATDGSNLEGYYTTTIVLADQAGNTVTLVTARVYLYDATLPAFTGGISLPALISGAATNTFAATATDNLDLADIFGDVAYPLATLRYPSQSLGTFGPPLTQTAAVSYAVSNWIRCINAAGSFATASGQPTGITLTVTDQADNAASLVSAPFGANAQACTGSVGNILPDSINSFVQNAPDYGAGKTAVDLDGASVAGTSSTSVTLTAVADVKLNMPDPFSRVDFFYDDGGTWVKIGTATVTQAQTATTRTHTYTFVWNRADIPFANPTVVAIGVDAEGDAVLTGTQAVATVP